MTHGPLSAYTKLVEEETLARDPAQQRAAERLEQLAGELAKYASRSGNWAGATSGGLFSVFRSRRDPPPQGVYIHGKVGRGKTMLMDLFFDSISYASKRRVHFHAFMADIHDRIASSRASQPGDPIPIVAASIAREARLICFDELHVTDITDAMILGRLFQALFQHDVVLVATSNASPDELYKDGLQRDLFVPFIDLLKERMDVVDLVAAKDYRLEKLANFPLYFSPDDAAADVMMRQTWQRLTGSARGHRTALAFKGREIEVPEAHLGVAKFSFAELCERPLGAADYLLIAHTFHTVMISHIPVLGAATRNEARRFINLIDTLYDNHVRLVASAAAEPQHLYDANGAGMNEAFLFERTVSRLMEMRSDSYLAGSK